LDVFEGLASSLKDRGVMVSLGRFFLFSDLLVFIDLNLTIKGFLLTGFKGVLLYLSLDPFELFKASLSLAWSP
jgi:hypothetical protein